MMFKNTLANVLRKKYRDLIYSQGSDEYRINCVYSHRRGPDQDHHLYINVKKGVGHCFQCGKNLSLKEIRKDVLKGETFFIAPQEQKIETKIVVDNSPWKEKLAKVASYISLRKALEDRQINSWDKKVLRYLHKRKVSNKNILQYEIGYSMVGRYAYRVIVPIFMFGKLQSFIARDFTERQKTKTLFPSKSDPFTTPKSLLFNYDIVSKQDECFLVEGAFDSMFLGIKGLASLGKKLSSEQLELIAKADFKRIYVMRDLDALKEALEQAKELSIICNDVRVVKLKQNDPDEHTLKELADCIEHSLREDEWFPASTNL